MYKKKSLFVTFEGIEGCGKTYQSRKLFNSLKKAGLPVIYTREPGGTDGAEKIRKIILSGVKNKFKEKTDTLLYLAARNEHFERKLRPAILKKNNIICDRFIDSTLAYQVYGKKINKRFVEQIHKEILGKVKPDLTFILKVNINKAFQRLNKRRKNKNRYDKFNKSFYSKVQKFFINIANQNKKRCYVIDNSKDSKNVEKIILKKFLNLRKYTHG